MRLKKQACPEQSRMEPIYSYCVLRDAYCENVVEKTKPISCFVYRMWYIVCRVLKKQSQFAGELAQSFI
jgi:hypothetical protein